MNSDKSLKLLSIFMFSMLLFACAKVEQQSELCESHYLAKSYKVAKKQCQNAANKGDARAQYYLAKLLYAKGKDPEVWDRADQLIYLSAEQGYDKAEFYRSIMWLLSQDPKSQDPKTDKQKAFNHLELLAKQGDAVAQYWVGNTFMFGYIKDKKSVVEAVEWFELSSLQGNSASKNNLAWIKVSTSGTDLFDPVKGLELAKYIVEKHPKSHGYLDTLAAAYAANGEFEKATSIQKKVIKMAEESGCSERCKTTYQKHLEIYLNNRPIIDETLFED